MRRNLVASLALLLALGCSSERRLRMALAPDPLTPQIAGKLAEVLDDAGLNLQLLEGEGSLANLERLQRGEADLAIVENNAAYRPGVRTVLPLYESVLHVLHERGRDPADARELLRGKRIFAGSPGGMGRWFLGEIRQAVGLPEDAHTLVEDLEDESEVIFLFRPISPAVTARIEDDYRFFSIGSPADLGRGAIVEGLALEHPQLEPFVIPALLYGRANPDPVLTVSVATLLVAAEDLPEPLIYDLTEAVLEHKQALASVHPSLFHGITESFDVDTLNFALHPGARAYLARDEPGILERYAELAGVSFSVSLAVASGLIAFVRWRERVKKNRIDAYYAQVLRIRAGAQQQASEEACDQAIADIREIESRAFAELIQEKLAADESFRIFTTLASETVEAIERSRKRSGPPAALASRRTGG